MALALAHVDEALAAARLPVLIEARATLLYAAGRTDEAVATLRELAATPQRLLRQADWLQATDPAAATALRDEARTIALAMRPSPARQQLLDALETP